MNSAITSGTPSDELVEAQLQRLLASPRFKKTSRRADLLAFIVRWKPKPNEKELSEKVIRSAVFKEYEGHDTNIARVTLRNLRESLDAYYANEGKCDPVIISVPKGKLYKTSFRYGEFSETAQKCKMIRNHLLGEYPVGNVFRLVASESLVKVDPLYAPAHVCVAECKLWYALDHSMHSTLELLGEALASAEKAIELSPDSWLAHIVLGAISSCHRNWEYAEKSFNRALSLAPDKTKSSLYFAAYLFSRGRLSEGLEAVSVNAYENPQDALVQAVYGLFLLAAGNLNDACTLLEEGINSGKGHRLGLVFLACTKISPHKFWKNPKTEAERFATDSFFYVPRKNKLNDDDLFDLNGPFDLPTNAFMASALLYEAHEQFNSEEEAGEAVLLNGFDGLQFCAGLHGYCNAQAGYKDAALSWLEILDEERQFFQKALGAYGFSDVVKTISLLWEAAKNNEPLTIWLHLWPIFDPIRHHPAFQELLKDSGLPENNVMRYLPCPSD